jgi:EAL domain-containing protein (putative c-di-GMP-specific phosphodiesterase class I)
VDIATGRAVAAEALTRWDHPRHGLLPPAQWLSLMERSELLPGFTLTVLHQAIAAASRWRAAGVELTVAVNISPHSLLDPRFPELVQHALSAHRLDPGRLLIEIVESTSVTQLQQAEQSLAELRAAGVRLALDDFGTGNSSLTVLSRVAVDQLKIDRTFVAAMRSSTEAEAVVRSTIELARTLGLDVVAEGVETSQQRRALWELGCGSAQGHLFGKPVTGEELLRLVVAGTDGVPSCLAPPIHPGATVIPLHHRHRPA